MPRASWKGFIRLSLVSVPVEGYTASAAGETQLALNQLHAGCGSRIRYKKTCEIHGEVASDQIVMGYQFERDQYVTVDPQELQSLRSERDYSINIDRFVDPEQLDPLYFAGKTYYLLPQGKAGEKPYALLQAAMAHEHVVGLAQVVISNREQLVALRPVGKLLTISVLQYAAHVRAPADFEEYLKAADVSQDELRLARTLVLHTKTDDADLAQFHDLYNERLQELVEAKVAGREVIGPPAAAPLPTINYMDAIRASLQRRAKGAPQKAARRATSVAKRPTPKKRKTG